MRRLSLLFCALLLGCGGGGGRHGKKDPVSPLSPYAFVAYSDAATFGAGTSATSFLVGGSVLTHGTLTIDGLTEAPSPTPEGAPERNFVVVVDGYNGRRKARYEVGESDTRIEFHEVGEGFDHVWRSTGGLIVDDGVHGYFRAFRLTKVTLVPATETGAMGTATLDGSLDTDLFQS